MCLDTHPSGAVSAWALRLVRYTMSLLCSRSRFIVNCRVVLASWEGTYHPPPACILIPLVILDIELRDKRLHKRSRQFCLSGRAPAFTVGRGTTYRLLGYVRRLWYHKAWRSLALAVVWLVVAFHFCSTLPPKSQCLFKHTLFSGLQSGSSTLTSFSFGYFVLCAVLVVGLALLACSLRLEGS